MDFTSEALLQYISLMVLKAYKTLGLALKFFLLYQCLCLIVKNLLENLV